MSIDIGGYCPGAIGRIAELHGEYYHRHWGFGLFFEAKVATELAEFLGRFEQGCDGFWTLCGNGRVEGAIAIDILQWGSILLETRHLSEAQPLLMDYMNRLPHHFEARIMPTFVLAKFGQAEPAAEILLGAGPPYGRYLANHSLGVIEALLADGFRREARQFGQAVLDRRRFFTGRKHLATVVSRL